MKLIKALLLFVGLYLALPNPTLAQITSTQGKEFWLTFMQNGYEEHSMGGWVTNQVLISAKRNCSGIVTNPNTGWRQSFTVNANNITAIDIPIEQGYHGSSNYGIISNKAIFVESTDTISVYCSNIAYVSFDASFVLPVESLGNDYIIQCYDQSAVVAPEGAVNNYQTSAFAIVATENNTVVDITPACATLDGRPAGETYQVTMNAGETYHVRSVKSGSRRDLSGTRVTASDCKKIAVFNGNTLTCIPTTMDDGFDHVFEQAMPLRSWGKRFIVTSSLNRVRDFVKITSSADNNEIYKNGTLLTTLNAGQSHVFTLRESDESCFLQATHPSAVFLYNNSCNDGTFFNNLGDPSMVWIAPVEQRIDEVTFSTFNHQTTSITVHSINIIVDTDDINNVYLDGQRISPDEFHPVTGNSGYSFARKNISHGSHHISCANGFNAHVYGFGRARGYAYLVGSNAIDLSTSITINDVPVKPNETYSYCPEESMTFLAEVNSENYSIEWNFGDGTTSTTNPATHTFHNQTVYPVTMTITTDENECWSSASQTSTFYVDLAQHYVIEDDETCMGDFYSGYGFENVLVNNDTILTRLVDNPDIPVCKDSLIVYLTAHQSYHIPINDSRCWQGQPGIYDGYGFSFEFDSPGEYDRQLELSTVNGCDSTVYLHLTVADRITYEFSHHECSGSYVWDGETYTAAGTYSNQYTTPQGCDSLVTLHLTVGTNKEMEFDTLSCDTFIWNGQEYGISGDYIQVFDSYDGCDSTVTCHLTVGAAVEGATTTASACDSYTWYEVEYTDSGIFTKVFPSYMGCDSVLFLNLDMEYTPNPTEIMPADTNNLSPHWVITAAEFQINSYDFTLEDHNPKCTWDSVQWALDTPEAHWLIEPDMNAQPPGKTCTLTVLNSLPDTIWMHATVYNRCYPEGIVRRYWLLCSFYSLDENNAKAQFDVVPNPNNGNMELFFDRFEGRTDVKVYDMRGSLIDHFETHNGTTSNSFRYTMRPVDEGIYFFVVSGKDGILTKKVIVIH